MFFLAYIGGHGLVPALRRRLKKPANGLDWIVGFSYVLLIAFV